MRGDRLLKCFLCFLVLLFIESSSWQIIAQSALPTRLEPTRATLLSVNSPTKDEDPSVLVARDGTIFVAWFSDRGGNPDIYLTSTNDGTNWKPPIRVTTSAAGDYYPNLF